jgi:hypothetical protein
LLNSLCWCSVRLIVAVNYLSHRGSSQGAQNEA